MEHYGAVDGALWSTNGALLEHLEQLWSTDGALGAAIEH
jgi:hypothetical protein